MNDILLSSLSIAYALGGIICCLAYIPTIKDLYFHKKASANISTYTLWSITATITLLYSIFQTSDLLFTLISIINLIACSTILILSKLVAKTS